MLIGIRCLRLLVGSTAAAARSGCIVAEPRANVKMSSCAAAETTATATVRIISALLLNVMSRVCDKYL